MSGPRSLLERWARLKSAARASRRETDRSVQDDRGAPNSDTAQPAKTPQPFDLASLPPIESIDAETDLRAFLSEGVPAEIKLAALRRGWSADPAIRDFIGLSENSWDFNAPGAMLGFGSLAPEEIRRLAAQIMGQAEATEGVAGQAAQASAAHVQTDAPPTQAVEPESKPARQDEAPPHSNHTSTGLQAKTTALLKEADSGLEKP